MGYNGLEIDNNGQNGGLAVLTGWADRVGSLTWGWIKVLERSEDRSTYFSLIMYMIVYAIQIESEDSYV